jgi:IS605 OrfB family transposase
MLLSKDIVALAKRQGSGIRLEDLSGIRQTAKQRKSTKSDAGQNRDYWPFRQLEQFIGYKARLAGVALQKVPAAYTSKTCHACGHINNRKKHAYRCERCGRQAHADANAAMNIRDWEGLRCPLVLEAPTDGRHGTAPNMVREAAGA